MQDLKLAILIDADNISPKYVKVILDEAASFGVAACKRIYGDWSDVRLKSWKDALLNNSIIPIQQYSYTTGKNSTDSAMIIDAMDILYTGEVDGFVLVSSDSDFTRLAVRLREAGKKVYGMGERKTPSPFIVACDKFVYIEVIRSAADQARAEEQARTEPPREEKTAKTKKSSKKKPEDPSPAPEPEPSAPGPADGVPPEIITLIADSLDMLADEDGYTFMGDLGNLLVKKQPDFDPRNFGFSKLTNLVRALDRFEVDVRQTSLPHVKHIFVRDRQRK